MSMLNKLFNALGLHRDNITEKPHPEVDNYGLNCDYTLWSEFNKEKLIRNWIKASRDYAPKETIPNNESPEFEFGNLMERKMADRALEELVAFGHLNPITYLRED